jgi:hypothetical protein
MDGYAAGFVPFITDVSLSSAALAQARPGRRAQGTLLDLDTVRIHS